MNPSKTAIIVDSGCDVSKQLIQKYDMKQLSLKVIYPEKMYMDGEDIKPQMVYERFPAEIPSTSMANIQDVLDLVDGIREQGYENVIGITISGAMSGTFNSVRLALEEVTDLKTFAFDTKNISIGGGILAIWAARKLEEGMSFDEVVSGLQQKIHDTKLCFYMDTLDYLARGGRITPSVAIVGKMLKLKPLQRALLPLISLALLTSCASRQITLPPAWTPQRRPQVLPLPSEAKQPAPPPECSPTCLETLQKRLDDMLQSLTNATQQV